MNNDCYKEQVYYRFDELLDLLTEAELDDIDKILKIYSLLYELVGAQTDVRYMLKYGGIDDEGLLKSQKYEDDVKVLNKTPYTALLNLIKGRYGDHYLPPIDQEIEGTIHDEADKPYMRPLVDWAIQFTSTLLSTKDKYVNILNIYDNHISNLMNGLRSSGTKAEIRSNQFSETGNGSKQDTQTHNESFSENDTYQSTKTDNYTIQSVGKNINSDTPQSIEIQATLDGDQFVSSLDKSHVTTSNSGTTGIQGGDSKGGTKSGGVTTTGTDSSSRSGSDSGSVNGEDHAEMDTKYTMEKIAEIQQSYMNVIKQWSNEFDGLFLEGGNIE